MKHAYFLFAAVLIFTSAFAQPKNTSTYKTGQTFHDCSDCPEMVVIPTGSFIMGSTEKELGNNDYTPSELQLERPQHKVNVKQFAAGKFDITKAEWAAFVKATNRVATGACSWAALPNDTLKPWEPNKAANWNHVGFKQDSTHPAICITWNDAQDYIQWLNKKTGLHYRLLTEAEWEYAARAGTSTAYPWGDSASHEYANYGTDTTAGVGFASGRDKWIATSPVGSFPPNQFGLYDMNGNVLQWVQDCVSDSYTNFTVDGSVYTSEDTLKMKEDTWSWMNGKKACSFRMCRGGDAWDNPPLIRSASRNWGEVSENKLTDFSSAGLGFRVARTL
jgi:formylglycine-generating enzyme required for sulfatase activity